MKKLLLILSVLSLTACSQIPVARNFPDVPQDLLTSCPDLKQVEPKTTKLSEVVSVVAANYGQYQECKIKVDAWVEWYKTQKEIFQSVK
jgi:hypothetical protein